MTLAIDSETALIEQGRLDPDLVCVSFCDETYEPGLLHWSDSFEWLRSKFQTANITGANFPFDSAVFMRAYPELTRDIFTAYFDSRIVDIQLNQRLLDIADGTLDGYWYRNTWTKRYYSLAALHDRYGFGVLEKDEWRLRYAEVRNVPLERWEPARRKYALDDALATQRVHQAQQPWAHLLLDGPRQARAAFALHLQSVRGMVTDRRRCQEFVDAVNDEIKKAGRVLLEKGLVDGKGKRNTKPAKRLMLEVCVSNSGTSVEDLSLLEKAVKEKFKTYTRPPTEIEVDGTSIPVTATGGIRLDAEACNDSGDAVLQAYALYTSSNSMNKKASVLFEGAAGLPLQTSYVYLLETGRTSSRAPMHPQKGDNFQNIRTQLFGAAQVDMRSCFVPREGYYLCSIDYSMKELHCVAQICKWLFGYSTLAEALIAGKDVHCMLGAQLMGCSYEEHLANKKTGRYKDTRDQGKIGNFGKWGMMGAKKLMISTNKKVKDRSKKLTLAQAYAIDSAWKRTWVESTDYAAYVKNCLGEGGLATIKQFKSERIRGLIDYSTTANTLFQGLAADSAKSTLLPIAYACYVDEASPLFGSRPLLFIHDELLLELKIDRAHEAALAARDLMVDGANEWLEDVPVSAEPALMTRWLKAAEPKYDTEGKLVPWA